MAKNAKVWNGLSSGLLGMVLVRKSYVFGYKNRPGPAEYQHQAGSKVL